MVFLRPRPSLFLLYFPKYSTSTILIYIKLHNLLQLIYLPNTSLAIILITFYLWFLVCSHDPKQNPSQEANPSLKIRFASQNSFPRSFISYLYVSSLVVALYLNGNSILATEFSVSSLTLFVTTSKIK